MRPPLTAVEQRNQALKEMRKEEGMDFLGIIWEIAQDVAIYLTGIIIVMAVVAGIVWKIF